MVTPKKKAVAATLAKYNDSDTELEDDDICIAVDPPSAAKLNENKASNVDNGSDTADDEQQQQQRSAKKARAATSAPSPDSEVEESSSPPPRRSPRKKRKDPPSVVAASEKKTKRKIVILESDSDNDDFETDPAVAAAARRRAARMMDEDDDDDDDDDDFQPRAEPESDEEEDNDDDADFVEPRSPKKTTTPASKRASPRRKKPAAAASPFKSTRPTKASPKKRKATVKKEEPTPPKPPKYHPPSSKLITRIPFLETTIQLSHPSTNQLPKLPDNNPNFNIDNLTPRCLDGLTFVLSGILSTNDAATSQTNADISLSSPTKGDYYTNRQFDCSTSNCELSRDTASDVIKSLGGRVTTGVSGKTDYLVVGSILEDGRAVEEGSKYRKCVDIWEGWRTKWQSEYAAAAGDGIGDDGKKKTKGKAKAKPKKDQDPNTLVEITRGIYEFYGLVVYLSEWKKGTLSEAERLELEASQQPEDGITTSAVKEEVKMEAVASTPSASTANPYASASSAASASASKTPVANPYANKAVSNPYAKKSTPTNPYLKPVVSNPYTKSAVSNPYTKKSPSSNPYAAAATTATASSSSSKQPLKNVHPTSKKKLGINSLWADRYAPSTSREILGNSDSVNKLTKWLNGWERTFNNPNRKVKGCSGPNGPWKAALLSGPPGIGKTTTATLVANESGRDVLELNASDARSKKALSEALGDVTGSQVLTFDNMGSSDSKKKKAPVQRRVIIMDEVDGMGAGDRSGMAELIQMIKKSKVPIICICNDRSSQKMRTLTQYCMDLRYRRPTKMVIARRAVEIGRQEGMNVEINAAEAMAESCGNDIRQVLNSLQMWSCKKKVGGSGGSANMTYRDLKERQGEINKDEVLRVSMFDACRSIVEGSRGLSGADSKAVTTSLFKRTDAFFVDYMMMGLMVHQNYLKVCQGQFNGAKLKGDDDAEMDALNQVCEATRAMSDFGVCEENLRGGDQNWSLLPLCSVLAVKVGHHAGGPGGGMLPGYPEFAGWLGKNSSRNKKIRLLQEFRRHMNYKVSADAPELRMNYLPIMRQQFEELLFDKEGAKVTEAIELMDEYGLDRDDVFENFDEFLFNSKELKVKKFGDLDSKSKAAFTRAYNSMAHKAQALVSEQGAEKTGRKKAGGGGGGDMGGGAELDVVDDDKAAAEDSDDEDNEEDLEALKKKFLKKGRGKKATAAGKGKAKAASKTNG
eukprot:CAMPEP_0172304216 /NCGR_PEP_ID=MMETSP1058-20130122/5649_1 /TAXON_ID=83371 /ORGANISM="Detonula confervacea, Strain CCMP 353" /LENGTH=1204 /DNA_ID=CAMNT_0013015351 /DNA_START=106 /DNA_END=3718 /DNA_ORIENTATION=-